VADSTSIPTVTVVLSGSWRISAANRRGATTVLAAARTDESSDGVVPTDMIRSFRRPTY
jgi:hypothetical protein